MPNPEEDRQQDLNSALPDVPGPPVAERKRSAWALIALLVVLAVGVAIVTVAVISNGGSTP
jgi:hypothetical protein